MTDKDIIKALECCKTASCLICPCFKNNLGIVLCQSDLANSVLDLINRQKAEIERLKEYEDIRPTGCPNCHKGNFSNSKFCCHCGKQLQGKKKDVKSEAIKEFAERLKKIKQMPLITNNDINNLVKEMTESEVEENGK